MKCVGRSDLDLLLDGFRGVQPVFNIVGIGELQAKVVFLDEIQSVENLLIEITRERLFLRENVMKAIKSES